MSEPDVPASHDGDGESSAATHLAGETVAVDVDMGVATVTLWRPEKLNAIDATMQRELEDALRGLDADADVRAIVLTGAGSSFCAGADVSALAGHAGGEARPPELRQAMRHGSRRVAATLLDLETPLVAAVRGHAAGAGVGLALAADVVVAAEDATFTVAFARRGLVPDYGVTFLLPRLVGLRAARELCLLGEAVTAPRAAELGMVSRVVPADDVPDAAAEVAARLASGPTAALGLTKRLLLSSFDHDVNTALDREFTAQALAFSGEDAAEGAASFLERRPPDFSGR